MDEQLFSQIEDYLQNRMTSEQRLAFEKQMKNDPQLQKEVNKQLELINAIETEAMKERLDQLHEVHFGDKRATVRRPLLRRLRPLAVAASIALLLLASWWALRTTSTQEDQLFTQYYETPQGLPTLLGIGSNQLFNEGMTDYKLGDFSTAQRQWLPLLQQNPSNDTLLFYLGISYLETDQTDSAVALFEEIIEQNDPQFRQQALWYLALGLIKNGRADEANVHLKALLQSDSSFKERAQYILDRLE